MKAYENLMFVINKDENLKPVFKKEKDIILIFIISYIDFRLHSQPTISKR